MAGQIPGGADDAPDLAIAELSEETTPPLCSLRRWLWVWDRRQWPPQPFGHNFSPLLCALFAILFATNRVRVLCVVCAVRQFACSWLPLRFAPLAAGCFLCHRTLGGLDRDVCGHGGGGFARLPWYAGQISVVGGRRGAPESVVCSATAVGSVVFHNHNAIAATPHPSPILWGMFPHRLRAPVYEAAPYGSAGSAASSPSPPPGHVPKAAYL